MYQIYRQRRELSSMLASTLLQYTQQCTLHTSSIHCQKGSMQFCYYYLPQQMAFRHPFCFLSIKSSAAEGKKKKKTQSMPCLLSDKLII